MRLNSSSLFRRLLNTSLILALLLFTAQFGRSWAEPARAATTLADLQAQQKALQQAAVQYHQQAMASKSTAENAQNRYNYLVAQSDALQNIINDTSSQIDQTQNQISDQKQKEAALESERQKKEDQLAVFIRKYWEMYQSQNNPILTALSNQPISQQQEQQAQFNSLKKSLDIVIAKTEQARQAVIAVQKQLEQKNNDLVAYQTQQQREQQDLADAQQQAQDLQANAQQAELAFEAKEQDAKAKAAQIADKIRLLSITTNWGTGIVSSDDGSWYYSQTGDYTTLGYSRETVNNVGCLITSLAMVATYYGHHITPDYIATYGSFDGWGNYYWGTPAGLGISITQSGRVNWNVVNQELAAGHPVVVSIYLPQIGQINADGSSHYIVLKALSDGKYLMHDPIGPGRSYSLNQVRSMLIIR